MSPARPRHPAPEPLTAEGFRQAANVSRETMTRLEAYIALLRKWQPRINLVSADSLADVWRRHVLDSAQLMALAPAGGTWLDLGSGAGFPGLVTAILGEHAQHLVESDERKCVFLREAARAAAVSVAVHNLRAEDLTGVAADVVTARAVAPLGELLGLAAPHGAQGGIYLFHKGQDMVQELTEATKYWKMGVLVVKSVSDPTGRVLRIEGAEHV